MMGGAGAGSLQQAIRSRRTAPSSHPARLNSWKEVARYFERDERTVKRWEVARGLPIHRLPGEGRSKVYALTEELEAWLSKAPDSKAAEPPSEAAVPAAAPARPLATSARLALASALVVIVVTGMAWRLNLAPQQGADAAPGSRNARALELFREGQHAWATRTPAGLAQAKDEFTQAIVADPDFAGAYNGLANTLLLEREYDTLPDDQAYPQALAAAQRAIRIDPGLAEAHSTLGFVDFYWLWKPAEAEGQFRQAIRLDPRDVTSRIWYAGVLRLQRRYAEGLAQVALAQAQAPESTQVLITKAMLQVEGGQAAQGDRLLSDIELAEPGQMWPHLIRARDYLLAGRLQDYLRERREALALRPDAAELQVMDAAANGLLHGGRASMLNAELKTQLVLNASGKVEAYPIAETYALLGDSSDSIKWLHRAVGEHEVLVLGALSDPIMATERMHGDLHFLDPFVMGEAGPTARSPEPIKP